MGACPICGKNIGLLSTKVFLKDGTICLDCLKAAGYPQLDTNTIIEIRNYSIAEFENMIGEANEAPAWNNRDYVLDRVKRVIVHPNIALKKKEVCFLHVPGEIGKKKTKATTYTQKSRSYKTITGKRVTYGTKTANDKEYYYEKTPCEFYMTSDRFIATVPQGSGFNINMNKVMGISLHKDALEIQSDGRAYIIFMSPMDVKKFKDTWDLFGYVVKHGITEDEILNLVQPTSTSSKQSDELLDEILIETAVVDEKESTSNKHPEKVANPRKKKSETAKVDPVDEIRRYKALLDEGIITQEEFEKKKQQLLLL